MFCKIKVFYKIFLRGKTNSSFKLILTITKKGMIETSFETFYISIHKEFSNMKFFLAYCVIIICKMKKDLCSCVRVANKKLFARNFLWNLFQSYIKLFVLKECHQMLQTYRNHLYDIEFSKGKMVFMIYVAWANIVSTLNLRNFYGCFATWL